MRSLSGIGRAWSAPSKQTRNEGNDAACTSTMPFASSAVGVDDASRNSPGGLPSKPPSPPASPAKPRESALEHAAVPITAPLTSAVSER